MDAAAKATVLYDYIPGVVTISAVDGFGGTNVKRFYGTMVGQVVVFDDTTLCYPGTWRIDHIYNVCHKTKYAKADTGS